MSYLNLLSQSLSIRYDSAFNFHYSKPISDIMRYRPHFSPFILFSQYLRTDCQEEMLKRYYSMLQFQRVPILAEYYFKHRMMEYEAPLLFLTEGRKMMFKRIKRRYKRLIKEKREEQQEERYQNSQTFLKTIKTEDLEESEEVVVKPYEMSMQSEVHDIYQGNGSWIGSKMGSKEQSVFIPELTLFNRGDRDREREKDRENRSDHSELFEIKSLLKDQKQSKQYGFPSHLILDFNDKDIDCILKQYNSLHLHNSVQIFDRNSIQSISSRQKPPLNSKQLKQQRLSTMSKSKRTLHQQTSRKQTQQQHIIKNIKVSEQYYQQGSNPQMVKYKRMININEKKPVLNSNRDKNNRLSQYKISSPQLPHPHTPKVGVQHKKMFSKDKDQMAARGRDKEKNKQRERVNIEVDRLKSPNGFKKSKGDQQYQNVKNKANKVEDQAMRMLDKFRKVGKIKSSQHLLKGYKSNSKH